MIASSIARLTPRSVSIAVGDLAFGPAFGAAGRGALRTVLAMAYELTEFG